jgi:hypothetical protein
VSGEKKFVMTNGSLLRIGRKMIGTFFAAGFGLGFVADWLNLYLATRQLSSPAT